MRKAIVFSLILFMANVANAYLKGGMAFYNADQGAFQRKHVFTFEIPVKDTTITVQYNWIDEISSKTSNHNLTGWVVGGKYKKLNVKCCLFYGLFSEPQKYLYGVEEISYNNTVTRLIEYSVKYGLINNDGYAGVELTLLFKLCDINIRLGDIDVSERVNESIPFSIGVSKLFKTGSEMGIDLVNNVLPYISGDKREIYLKGWFVYRLF
jgi:hypothetical protein